jgi:uncharacterized protein
VGMKRILLPLALITFMTGMIHYFLYWTASFSLSDGSAEKWAVYLLFLLGWILMPVGMIVSMTRLKHALRWLTVLDYYWMGFFIIALFYSVIELLLLLFGTLEHSEWVLAASFLTSLWAAFRGHQFPMVITREISGPAVMRGLTLVQISDVHIGMPGLDQVWLNKVVETINSLQPHFVAITGDLVDDQFAEASPQLEPLKELRPSKGKFYITGNHEYIRPGDWEQRLGELGLTVLHNSHQLINLKHGTVLIAGVPDKTVSRFIPELHSNPDEALKTEALVNYKILLAHQPSSVFDLKKEKCDLMLSGHTHGGQIFPFGAFVRIVQPVVFGFKRIKGTLVFAHQGTGRWGPPMRWLTRAEIVQFKWI